MPTTKPDSETGWSKDVPTTNGWYWLKDDKTGPVLTEALNGCFYVHNSRYMPEPNDEWLGPFTASDFEQLIRLRQAGRDAVATIQKLVNVLDLRTQRGMAIDADRVASALNEALVDTGEHEQGHIKAAAALPNLKCTSQ